MSEAVRNVAMARYRMIQPYLEQKRSLAMVADDADVCVRTAQRWVSRYRKRGLVALARKSRDDRGARRVPKADPFPETLYCTARLASLLISTHNLPRQWQRRRKLRQNRLAGIRLRSSSGHVAALCTSFRRVSSNLLALCSAFERLAAVLKSASLTGAAPNDKTLRLQHRVPSQIAP
jgi:hypothetical protein